MLHAAREFPRTWPSLSERSSTTRNGHRFDASKIAGNPEQQDGVANTDFRFSRKPTVYQFSEHAILFHGLSARYGERRGAELEAATKGLGVPRCVSLMKALDPVSHPREVGSPKQVDHQEAEAGIAGRNKSQLELGIQQLRGVMLKCDGRHGSQIQSFATLGRGCGPSKLRIRFH